MENIIKSLLTLVKCRKKRLVVLGLVCAWLIVCGVIVVKIKVRQNNSTPLKRREGQEVLPILIIACHETFVTRSLRSLTYFRKNKTAFPIIVYNDPSSYKIKKVVDSYTDWDQTITVIQNPKPNNARHLKIPLDHVFGKLLYEAVIILDDNLDISPDFFEYFLATYRLLKKDRSIWCVSAWNVNCKRELIDITQPHQLHWTDFFPGKGWMIRYETWKEIRPESDVDVFDADSLYYSVVTRNRVCIRPEISRTYCFGMCKKSNIQTEDRDLEHRQRELNTEFIPFTHYDLSYLLKKHELSFLSHVYSCPEATVNEAMSGVSNSSFDCVQIPYSNPAMFKTIAKTLGLKHEFQRGVAPNAYHGIVQCFIKGQRVYLVPTNAKYISTPRSMTSKKKLVRA